jgi:hypothetical protein
MRNDIVWLVAGRVEEDDADTVMIVSVYKQVLEAGLNAEHLFIEQAFAGLDPSLEVHIEHSLDISEFSNSLWAGEPVTICLGRRFGGEREVLLQRRLPCLDVKARFLSEILELDDEAISSNAYVLDHCLDVGSKFPLAKGSAIIIRPGTESIDQVIEVQDPSEPY